MLEQPEAEIAIFIENLHVVIVRHQDVLLVSHHCRIAVVWPGVTIELPVLATRAYTVSNRELYFNIPFDPKRFTLIPLHQMNELM
jgi:hypothetical protein